VSGTINGAGTWISGQGNYFTITSVPNEIITGNNNFVFNMVTGVDCELPPPPCDTIYVTETEFLTDTIYVTETEFLTDTLYITQTLTDTVEVLVDNYIYETDTLTVIETQLIDCETGEECVDPPGLSECWPWTVYIPNTFTPNNDGINDIWQIIYDLDCWVDVEFKIFNRWGSQIYYGFVEDFETYPYWDGSINGGDYYVSDGVYLYTFYGRKSDSPEILEESGYITIFR
jgi:gliding motility-associated-like protein